MEKSAFWKARRVLVTGHTGFKGSWLSILLTMLGAEVIGYALNPRTQNDNFEVCGLSDRITDIRSDICDPINLEKTFSEYNPEIVFHLAAQPLVLESYKDIKGTYETNVIGTLNLLECVKNCEKTKCAVIITTDKCYENREQIWGYRENDALGGYDPYSSSKACVEILVSSFRNSFLNPTGYDSHRKAIATVRAGNVIGGGDWAPDRLVPDCINSLIHDEKICIRNPQAIRPWQHVIEPLYGYLLLAQNLVLHGAEYSEAWNFGPDPSEVTNVWDLATMIKNAFGKGELVDESATKSPHEASMLSLDITKAIYRLGWKPRLSIKQAVEMTVAWYKQNNELLDTHDSQYRMYELCVKQIYNYLLKVAG